MKGKPCELFSLYLSVVWCTLSVNVGPGVDSFSFKRPCDWCDLEVRMMGEQHENYASRRPFLCNTPDHFDLQIGLVKKLSRLSLQETLPCLMQWCRRWDAPQNGSRCGWWGVCAAAVIWFLDLLPRRMRLAHRFWNKIEFVFNLRAESDLLCLTFAKFRVKHGETSMKFVSVFVWVPHSIWVENGRPYTWCTTCRRE